MKKILFLQDYSMQRKGGGVSILKRLISNASDYNYTTQIAYNLSSNYDLRNNTPGEISFFTLPRKFRFGIGRLIGLITICCLDFLAIISLVRLIKKIKPDVIHITAHGVCFPVAVLAARLSKKKTVISVHDLWPFTITGYIPGKIADIIFKRCIRKIHTVFVISPEMANYLSAKYGEKNYQVIHDGIENMQNVSHSSLAKTEDISFIYIGLLHEKQYALLNTFLKSLSRIENKCFKIGICSDTNIPGKEYPNIEIINYGWLNENELKQISKQYTYGLLPLSFEKKDELFYHTSLMTKIPFYIGMGLPIIAIGPGNASAIRLIKQEEIGIAITSPKEEEIEIVIRKLISNNSNSNYTNNLQKTADTIFNIKTIRQRFFKNVAL